MSSVNGFCIKFTKEIFGKRMIGNLHSTIRSLSSKQYKHSNFMQQIYSDEESRRILDVLNNNTKEQLTGRKLGTNRFRQFLLEGRPFDSLSQILSLSKLNIVQMEKVCALALTDEKVIKEKNSISTSHCYPAVNPIEATAIKTVTSLNINGHGGSWVTMTDDLAFVQARKFNFKEEIIFLKYDHVKYTKAMQDLVKQLPQSDVYLLPEVPYRLAGKTAMAAAYHGGQRSLEATFCGLVAGQNDIGKVYTLRTADVASVFNLSVGGEIVRTDQVLDKIVEAGHWRQHYIKELDALRHQHTSFDNHQSLLTLQCLAFLTEILYPIRQKK